MQLAQPSRAAAPTPACLPACRPLRARVPSPLPPPLALPPSYPPTPRTPRTSCCASPPTLTIFASARGRRRTRCATRCAATRSWRSCRWWTTLSWQSRSCAPRRRASARLMQPTRGCTSRWWSCSGGWAWRRCQVGGQGVGGGCGCCARAWRAARCSTRRGSQQQLSRARFPPLTLAPHPPTRPPTHPPTHPPAHPPTHPRHASRCWVAV